MSTHVDADALCPHDPDFVHRFYFGCVPADFSDRTGRSKTHRQTRSAEPIEGLHRYQWDGGCDAAGVRRYRK